MTFMTRGEPKTALPMVASKRGAAAPRVLLLAAVFLSAAAYARAEQNPCEEFARSVRATYNFKPSRLKDEAEYEAKAAAMDRFWAKVKADRKNLLPCLRAALKDPQADPWFRFDGGNLLVSLDPSPESKAELTRHYAAVDLGDVNLQDWVSKLARLGAEGFDVSEAGARWLAFPKSEYYLPLHGLYKVDKFLGAIFIYGSMDEAQATPALLTLAGNPAHPGQRVATSLLLMQATPEAFRGLKEAVLPRLPAEERASRQRQLDNPVTVEPREKPRTSREQFLKAFAEAAEGRWDSFLALAAEVPDGEKDVVATLKAEDVPLLRKVRRRMIANANQHAAAYYVDFTKILTTLVLRTEATK